VIKSHNFKGIWATIWRMYVDWWHSSWTILIALTKVKWNQFDHRRCVCV